MPARPPRQLRPGIEQLESKQPLSAGLSPIHIVEAKVPLRNPAAVPILSNSGQEISLDRVTNPHGRNALFSPPFGHVLVQISQPVPGEVYNLLFLSVYNATKRTFTASDGLTVRMSNTQPGVSFPILNGDQQWKPGGRIVFYLVSKKYYPLTPTQSAGFQFNFVRPRATAIPGPSGIALRVKYDPATINAVLDRNVVSGPGSIGHKFGIPVTAIWQILPNSKKLVHL